LRLVEGLAMIVPPLTEKITTKNSVEIKIS